MFRAHLFHAFCALLKLSMIQFLMPVLNLHVSFVIDIYCYYYYCCIFFVSSNVYIVHVAGLIITQFKLVS